MKIAIIGAGNVGSAIARGVARAGHTVTLSATDPAKVEAVAAKVGGTAAASTAEAARDADVLLAELILAAVLYWIEHKRAKLRTA
jgi:8-hydroxy-5-deazaflavin:NADPH oxidoreductase